MIKTNCNNQMKNAMQHHHHSTTYNLFNAYAKPSKAKIDAFDYCKELCNEHNGRNLKIIGYNMMAFSAGFYFEDENGKACFAYITKDSDRYCEI